MRDDDPERIAWLDESPYFATGCGAASMLNGVRRSIFRTDKMKLKTYITEELARRVLSVVDQGLSGGLAGKVPGNMCIEAAICNALGEAHDDLPTFLPYRNHPKCLSPALRRLQICLNDARWCSNATRANGLRRLAIAQLGTAGVLDERLFAQKLSLALTTKLLPGVLRRAAALQRKPYKSRLMDVASELEGCKPGDAEDADTAVRLAATEADVIADQLETDHDPNWDFAHGLCWTMISARGATADAVDTRWGDSFDVRHNASATAGAFACTAVRWVIVTTDALRSCRRWSCKPNGTLDGDKLLGEFAEEVVQILVEMKAPGADYLFLTC